MFVVYYVVWVEDAKQEVKTRLPWNFNTREEAEKYVANRQLNEGLRIEEELEPRPDNFDDPPGFGETIQE